MFPAVTGRQAARLLVASTLTITMAFIKICEKKKHRDSSGYSIPKPFFRERVMANAPQCQFQREKLPLNLHRAHPSPTKLRKYHGTTTVLIYQGRDGRAGSSVGRQSITTTHTLDHTLRDRQDSALSTRGIYDVTGYTPINISQRCGTLAITTEQKCDDLRERGVPYFTGHWSLCCKVKQIGSQSPARAAAFLTAALLTNSKMSRQCLKKDIQELHCCGMSKLRAWELHRCGIFISLSIRASLRVLT